MPEQLKIVIDADAQPASNELKNFGKVFAGEFGKITNSATLLEKSIASSIQKINSSLASLKITSLDLSVNTSSIDASIKSIQSKFASLVDPELNILANTELAETKIRELLAELAALKGAEVFVGGNNSQALTVINEVEAELNSLIEKQIKIGITADLSKLNELKTKLSTLKVTPVDVSLNTATLDASIKNIQAKFNAIVDPQINVLANTELAEVKIRDLLGDIATLKGTELFIRANDTQVLGVINEVEAELNSLLKDIDLNVNNSTALLKVEQLKTRIANLKISPIDVPVDSVGVDAAVKRIQDKFAAIVDPELNILLNPLQAEAQIKELLSELSTLENSEVFINGNNSQALQKIKETKAELNNLLDKQIKLNINSVEASQKLASLEKELLDFQNLALDPKISSTQLALFEKNIIRIKGEIAALKGQGVTVPIDANVNPAQLNINKLSETIETLRAKIEARKFFITTETDITKIAQYNKEIDVLESKMRSIQNVGRKGFELFIVPNQTIQSVKSLSQSVASFGGGVKTFIPPAIQGFTKLGTSFKDVEKQAKTSGAAIGSAFSKAFGGLRGLAALIPGIGLGGIIGIAATAVNELTESLFKARDAAIKHSTAIEGVADDYAAAIASVNELKINIKLAKEGFISKDAVVKQYNESIGQTTGLVKNLDEAEKELGKNANAYIKFTLLKAAANFALEEASKKAVKAALIPNEDIKKNLSFFERLNLPFEKAPSRKSQEQKFLAPVIEGVKKEQAAFEKIAEDFQTEAAKIAQDMGFSFFKDFKIDKGNLNKEVDDVIARAKLAVKAFEAAFVVPDLEITFFKNKDQVTKDAKDFLGSVKSFLEGNISALQVKIPVQTDFEFLPVSDGLPQSVIDNFFKGIGAERKIPIEVIPDITISKQAIDDINKKLDLRKQFSIFGDLGFKEFNKIDFSNITSGIDEATKKLQGMMAVATTLQQSIGQGLTNAFNSVFDAVLEGKNVFKALAEGVKQLIVGTIKAIAQMLILRAVTSFIFPGAAAGGLGGGLGRALFSNQANFGQLSGIGNRAFQNVLTINVNGQISGDTIRLAGQRAANSQGRFG